MKVCNLGSGNRAINAPQIQQIWPGAEVVCVDADHSVDADLRDDLRNLSLADGSMDGAFCSHILEHFCEADVKRVLAEIWRVCKPTANVFIVVPDLTEAARHIVAGRLVEELYTSPMGKIRPIDVLYGYQPQVEGHPLMAHHFGFDHVLLRKMMTDAGFATTVTGVGLNLVGQGVRLGNSHASRADGRASDIGYHRVIVPGRLH